MRLHGDFLPVNVDIVLVLGQCSVLTSLHVQMYLLIHLCHYLRITNTCFLSRNGILSQLFRDSSTVHGSKRTALTWQKLKNCYSSTSLIAALRKKMWWPLIFLLFSAFLYSFISLNLKLFLFPPCHTFSLQQGGCQSPSDWDRQADPRGGSCGRSVSY